MSRDRYRRGEPTIDEIIADPIVILLMRADNVEPEALEGLLPVAVSPSVLRSEARRLRERARSATDPVLQQEWAGQAFDLAQRAEAIARWQEDPGSLPHSIECYRRRLAAGIEDAGQRQIIQQILHDAEQLAARLSDPRQPSATYKTIERIGPATATDRKHPREGNPAYLSAGNTVSKVRTGRRRKLT
jgi:hypothetical protein